MFRVLIKRPLFSFLVCLAGLVTLVPVYFYLLTTSVFDCAPVDSPELAPAGKSGPAIHVGDLPARFPAYQRWLTAEAGWREELSGGNDSRGTLDDPVPYDPTSWLVHSELALTAARELAVREGNWLNSYDEATDIHSWQSAAGMEILDLVGTLLLRSYIQANDQSACLETLRTAARLAPHIRELDQNDELLDFQHRLEEKWQWAILQITAKAKWAMDDAMLAEWMENLTLPKAEHDRHIANCLRGELLLDAARIGDGRSRMLQMLHNLDWDTLGNASTNKFLYQTWMALRTQPNRYVRYALPYYSAAIQQSSLPATARTLPVPPSPTAWQNWSPSPNAGAASMLMALSDERLQRILSKADNAAAHRGITLTALAILRYRVANGERWPTSLAELVPNYLSELPLDAYDGKPLRYDAESGRLWSIGKDGVDDGGLGEHAGGAANIFYTESGDIVLDLREWCREKPASSH